MIVLDASTVVELLLNTDRGRTVAERIRDPSVGLHAPHLLDVEVAQVLRRLHQAGDAVYIALAEALRAPLLTCDNCLARAPGIGCRIELV